MSTLSRKRSLSAEPAASTLEWTISQFVQSPLSAVPVFKDYPMDVSDGDDDDSNAGDECRAAFSVQPPASFCKSVTSNASTTPSDSTVLTTATRTSSLSSMVSVTPPPPPISALQSFDCKANESPVGSSKYHGYEGGRVGYVGAKFSVVEFPFTRNEDYQKDRNSQQQQPQIRGRGRGSGVQHTAEHIAIRPTLAHTTTATTALRSSQSINQQNHPNQKNQFNPQKGFFVPPTQKQQKTHSPVRRPRTSNVGYVQNGLNVAPLAMAPMVGAGFHPSLGLVPPLGMVAFAPFQGIPFGVPFFPIPTPANPVHPPTVCGEANHVPSPNGNPHSNHNIIPSPIQSHTPQMHSNNNNNNNGNNNKSTNNSHNGSNSQQPQPPAMSFSCYNAFAGNCSTVLNNNTMSANAPCPLAPPPQQHQHQHQPYTIAAAPQPFLHLGACVGPSETATAVAAAKQQQPMPAVANSPQKNEAVRQTAVQPTCVPRARHPEDTADADAEPQSPEASMESPTMLYEGNTRIRFVHPNTWRHEPYAVVRPVPNPVPIADDGTLTGRLRPVDVDPSLASATFSTSITGESVVELVPEDDGRHKQHKWVEINVNEPHEDLRKRRYRFSGVLPCTHRVFAKRLRYRRGWTYFMCVSCGFKWGESGAR